MSFVIRWEEPPPHGNGRKPTNRPKQTTLWRGIAAELREHPGRWALVVAEDGYNYAGGLASQIERGSLSAFRPRGSFEAVTRTVGMVRVYARFVGEPSSPEVQR